MNRFVCYCNLNVCFAGGNLKPWSSALCVVTMGSCLCKEVAEQSNAEEDQPAPIVTISASVPSRNYTECYVGQTGVEHAASSLKVDQLVLETLEVIGTLVEKLVTYIYSFSLFFSLVHFSPFYVLQWRS